jgi:small conductance mechanosensitive channel
MKEYLDELIALGVLYAPKIVGALLVLVIGFWITSWLTRAAARAMVRTKVPLDLSNFLRSLVNVLLKVLVVFSAAGIVGIETTSFVAVLAAAGFAVGLALQGSLSNFAAGVIILLFKPYRTGHVITTQNYTGTVKEIQILNTILTTLDNRVVVIPNGSIISNAIENFSISTERQLDLTFSIVQSNEIEKTRQVLQQVAERCPGYLTEKGIKIVVRELPTNAINLAVRFWTKNEDFWKATYFMLEEAAKALDEARIVQPSASMNLQITNADTEQLLNHHSKN